MERMDITQFNFWAKDHILDDSRFDNNGYIITENSYNYGIIAKIFEDHWNNYYAKYKNILDILRPNADKEVHKVIDCANHNLGSSVYVCPKCKTKEDIPFSLVNMLDKCDDGDDSYPPRFDCQICDGIMTPLYYKNYKGKVYEYKED